MAQVETKNRATSSEDSRKRTLARIEKEGIEFVLLWFTDIEGHLKSFAVTPSEIEAALDDGMGFDGSSITGFNAIEESDMVAIPDPETFQLMPWKEGETKVARMICDIVTPDGKPYEGDPRYVLRRALDRMASLGFDTFNVGPELEYFLFRDDKGTETLDEGGYFAMTTLDAGGVGLDPQGPPQGRPELLGLDEAILRGTQVFERPHKLTGTLLDLLEQTRIAEQRNNEGVVVLHAASGTHQESLKHVPDFQTQGRLQVESQRRIRAVLIEHGIGLKRLYVYPEFVIRGEVLLPRQRDLDLLPCSKPAALTCASSGRPTGFSGSASCSILPRKAPDGSSGRYWPASCASSSRSAEAGWRSG
jgi:hypothetical protein